MKMSVTIYLLFLLLGISHGYILPRFLGMIRVTEWAPAPTRAPLNLHDALQGDANFRISDRDAGICGLTAIKDSDLRACFISPYDPEWILYYDDKDYLMETIDPVRIRNAAELSEFQSEAGVDIAVMCKKSSIYWLPGACGGSVRPPPLRPRPMAIIHHSAHHSTSTSIPTGMASVDNSPEHQNTIRRQLLLVMSPAMQSTNNQRQPHPHRIPTSLATNAQSATSRREVRVPIHIGRDPIGQSQTTPITPYPNIQPNKPNRISTAWLYPVPTKSNTLVPLKVGQSQIGHEVDETSALILPQRRAPLRSLTTETRSGSLNVPIGRDVVTPAMQPSNESEDIPRVYELIDQPKSNPGNLHGRVNEEAIPRHPLPMHIPWYR